MPPIVRGVTEFGVVPYIITPGYVGTVKGRAANLPKVDAKNLPSSSVQNAGEKGWGKPYEYDYKLYNMTNDEAAKAEKYAVEAARLAGTLDESLYIPTWAANAKRYEWLDEYGDVGPRFPELEKMLFKHEYINRKGENTQQ